ncbi:uncharacterized protein LOC112567768 isoform X2 [Pomacea canaliculata]|uniref:uncharacterized protein LOC112567768 isoform X2 n=1 Tax=Pomacea canaliculata TaxID=400727 RepID=UPI000D7280E4|nr:uncharacterized protein LOC112567768 isoform X2 [Pomacea canaliculata]
MPKPHKLRKVKVADKVKMTWPKLTKKVISSKVKISEKQSRALEKRPKSVVKQILKKARRGHGRPRRGAKHVIDADKVVKRGRGRPPSKIKGTPHSGEKDSPVQPSHHKRATPMFVLPQYSRSSRVIIPNKRFLEEDSLVGSLLSKRPRMDTCSDTVSSSSKGKHLDKADSVNPVTHTLSGHWSDKSEAPSSGSQLSGIPQLDKSDISKTTKKGVKVRTRSASGQLSSVTLEKSEQHKTGDANLTTPRIKKKASKPQSLIEDASASNAEESTESAITSSSSCMTTGRKLGKADQAASSSDNTTVSLPKGKPSTDTECQANPVTSSGVDFDSVSGDLVGHVSTEELSPFKRGLLEQPLIVEGKRLRMPSLKVRMKLGLEASAEDLSEKTAAAGEKEDSAKNTISNREELNHAEVMESKFMLFPREPSSAPKAFFRAGPMKLHHHGKDGKESLLTKRSGQIVLRKAKLQLNRTALNRSKAALARSLKAQLKREARQQGKRHEMQASPPRIISSLSPVAIHSKKQIGEGSGEKLEVTERSAASGGPRIKHVCRRAAMVVRKPLATFSSEVSASPTLSALPSPEKERLLRTQGTEKEATKDSSEDERHHGLTKTPQVTRRGRRFKLVKRTFKSGIRRRKGRCKECEGCLAVDCGKCMYCRDRPKFGGQNILKQACIKRRCRRPRYSRQATEAFIQPKTLGNDEVDSSQMRQGPARSARPSPGFFSQMVAMSEEAEAQDEREDDVAEDGNHHGDHHMPKNYRSPAGRVHRRALLEEGSQDGSVEVVSAVEMSYTNLAYHRRRLLKRKEKTGLRLQMPPVVPQPVFNTATYWSLPSNVISIVHADFKEDYDIETTWSRGLALTMFGPSCMRAVCFLCGSAGCEKLLYCSVCCEPFHWFCLEEEDRPLLEAGGADNWCCKRCQFCHVCGLQCGLLQCDRCQDTYHPECLGPAYPTRPSRRNVWVCTKCVRCKSCGATTPGAGHNATWTYDFSLCYECGRLMDKGNFCPICRKCYSDDDWESKMVQCSVCDSWVHAKCEGLTDEMYQLLSSLPEEMQYTCRVCCPSGPAQWQSVLRQELLAGLRSVIDSLASFKCAHHLVCIDETKEKERIQKAGLRRKVAVLEVGCDASAEQLSLQDTQTSASQDDEEGRSESEQLANENSVTSGDENLEHSFEAAAPSMPSSDVDLQAPGDGRSYAMLSLNTASSKQAEKPETVSGDSCQHLVSASEIDQGVASITNALKNSTSEIDKTVTSSLKNNTEMSGQHQVINNVSKLGLTSSDCPNSMLPSSLDIGCEGSLDSQHKASRMSETGIFERLASGDSADLDMTLCPQPNMKDHPVEGGGGDILISCAADVTGDESHGDHVTSCISNETGLDKMKSGEDISERHLQNKNVSRNLFEAFLSVAGVAEEPSFNMQGQVIDVQGESIMTRDQNDVQDASQDSSQENEDSPEHHRFCDVSKETCEADEGRVCRETSSAACAEVNLPETRAGNCALSPQSTSEQVGGTEHIESTSMGQDFPRDFHAVRLKLEGGMYNSVEEFSEDMVRIIQTALNDEDQLPTRRKHNNSVRSIFIKQMERCFPWFNVKTCRLWQHNKTLPKGMLPEAVLPPSDDHTYAQWLEREDNPPSLQPSSFRHVPTSPHAFAERDGSSQPGITGEDSRQCALCLTFGDDEMEGAGRLLYAGQDDWVHVNCALWSAEVFEEADGTLQNVHVAMVRGRQLRCESCKTPGATVGCCVRGCPANYHFVCARHSDCVFLEDKTVFCSEHKQHADCRIGRQRKFAVHRRTCIDMADIRCMKKSWARGLDAGFINVLFGACTVENLGFLAPLSDFIGCLLPLEFKSTRIYWSTVDARRRTVYTCRIVEVQPTLSTPEVTVQDMRIVHDEEHPDFVPFETLSLPISGIQAHLHSSSNSHWGLPSLLDNSQAEQTGKRDDQDVWCVEDEDVYNSTHNPEKPSNIATEDTGSPIPSVSCTNEQEICRVQDGISTSASATSCTVRSACGQTPKARQLTTCHAYSQALSKCSTFTRLSMFPHPQMLL